MKSISEKQSKLEQLRRNEYKSDTRRTHRTNESTLEQHRTNATNKTQDRIHKNLLKHIRTIPNTLSEYDKLQQIHQLGHMRTTRGTIENKFQIKEHTRTNENTLKHIEQIRQTKTKQSA